MLSQALSASITSWDNHPQEKGGFGAWKETGIELTDQKHISFTGASIASVTNGDILPYTLRWNVLKVI